MLAATGEKPRFMNDKRVYPRLALRAVLLLSLSVLITLSPSIFPAIALAQDGISSFAIAPNTVLNWSFEEGFVGPDNPNKVATNWNSFVLEGKPQFWSGFTRFGQNVERIDGKDTQIIIGTEPFDAGIYQIITGLTANQWYSALAFVLTVFETSAVQDPSIYDDFIVRQIGIDPEGGRNPSSTSVIWSPPIGKNMDKNTWGQRMTFQATGSTATLFIRAQMLVPTSSDKAESVVFIDAVQFRVAPISQVIVPGESQSGPFEVRWQSVVPNAPASEVTVPEFDVDYRDGDGPWLSWLANTTLGKATFIGLPGHTYTFRVRGWGKYAYPFCWLFGPWAESASVSIGKVFEVTITDNRNNGLVGMTAQLLNASGQAVHGATTDPKGSTYLVPPQPTGTYSVRMLPQWYLAPAPAQNISLGEGVTPVYLTARPPDDLIDDGSFEGTELGAQPAEWTVIGQGIQVTNFAYHGGQKSLLLGTTPSESVVCLQKTFQANGAYRPVLSFWYKLRPPVAGMNKVLLVRLVDQASSQKLAAVSLQAQVETTWLHHYITASQEDSYSGTILVDICLRDPENTATPYSETVYAYVDDVSFGSSSGGPFAFHLPFVSYAP